MAISTVDGVVSGLGSGYGKFIIDKASLANQVAGRMVSLWRASGVPAIPAGACVFPMIYPVSTSSGVVKSNGKIIYG